MVQFVESLADLGRGVVAVEGAGDLVDVAADAVEGAQDLGAEDVRAAPVLSQGEVGGEPAGDEGEDNIGCEAGFALVAVLGRGLPQVGVLVVGEAQGADALDALVAGEAANCGLDALRGGWCVMGVVLRRGRGGVGAGKRVGKGLAGC
jgi:hypothetical protein